MNGSADCGRPQDSGIGGRQEATAAPWQVAWRVLLRCGVAVDRETAQYLADTLLALQQPAQPAPAGPQPRPPSRPARRASPDAGCEPMF
ncbi:MAG: hypothetical protein ACRDPD_07015 [Streptosporangiaceae bacterium]